MSAPEADSGFSERVEAVVAGIPRGYVMTYGQIAGICGNARAARIVGGIAHYGDSSLPWQRVVNKAGGLASGYPGGIVAHKVALESEDIMVEGEPDNWFVNIDNLLWQPRA